LYFFLMYVCIFAIQKNAPYVYSCVCVIVIMVIIIVVVVC